VMLEVEQPLASFEEYLLVEADGGEHRPTRGVVELEIVAHVGVAVEVLPFGRDWSPMLRGLCERPKATLSKG